MYREKKRQRDRLAPESKFAQRVPSAKYLSGVEIANVLRLLVELSEMTQSASSHGLAKQLIGELGGPNWQNDSHN
jgi:hypothetical protein